MTDNGFVIRGYVPHPPDVCDDENISRVFEKQFRDGDNLKYVIVVNKWLPMSNPETGEVVGPAYEYDVFVVPKDTDKSIRISFNYEWSVDAVEAEAKILFSSGLFDFFPIEDDDDDEDGDIEWE